MGITTGNLQFYRPAPFPRLRVAVPMVSARVCAGFPSPADDHMEGAFDLNELLIKNPPATFMVRVAGESMRDAQIFPGDILVVDRSVEAKDRSIIVACLDGEFTVKRLRKHGDRVWLQPENSAFPELEITAERDFQVWGVVTARVSQFKA
jgi:DNA polymerase V